MGAKATGGSGRAGAGGGPCEGRARVLLRSAGTACSAAALAPSGRRCTAEESGSTHTGEGRAELRFAGLRQRAAARVQAMRRWFITG
jgi:hypothetical protein